MPTYDYRCRFCDHEFEHFQNRTDKNLRKCPECKRQGLDRLIGTGAGIVFKGSGFYETDYRSKGYQADAKKDSEAPKTDSGKASAKQDKPGTSKSGDKPEPKAGGDSADKGKPKS